MHYDIFRKCYSNGYGKTYQLISKIPFLWADMAVELGYLHGIGFITENLKCLLKCIIEICCSPLSPSVGPYEKLSSRATFVQSPYLPLKRRQPFEFMSYGYFFLAKHNDNRCRLANSWLSSHWSCVHYLRLLMVSLKFIISSNNLQHPNFSNFFHHLLGILVHMLGCVYDLSSKLLIIISVFVLVHIFSRTRFQNLTPKG